MATFNQNNFNVTHQQNAETIHNYSDVVMSDATAKIEALQAEIRALQAAQQISPDQATQALAKTNEAIVAVKAQQPSKAVQLIEDLKITFTGVSTAAAVINTAVNVGKFLGGI